MGRGTKGCLSQEGFKRHAVEAMQRRHSGAVTVAAESEGLHAQGFSIHNRLLLLLLCCHAAQVLALAAAAAMQLPPSMQPMSSQGGQPPTHSCSNGPVTLAVTSLYSFLRAQHTARGAERL